MTETYPEVAGALAAMTDEQEQIALLRLAAKWNNGSDHFDHVTGGMSWLCLACGIAAGKREGHLALDRLVRYSEELGKPSQAPS